MISKDVIERTAICYWSDEDDCYLVESPLFDRVIGSGDTEKEAWEIFHEMFDDMYESLKVGNVLGYNKAGRPTKPDQRALNCRIKEESHDFISKLAKDLGISQGEAVDFLRFFFEKRRESTVTKSDLQLVLQELRTIKKRLPSERKQSTMQIAEPAARYTSKTKKAPPTKRRAKA